MVVLSHSPVVAFMPLRSYSGDPTLAILSWMSCPGCLVLLFLFSLCQPTYPLLFVHLLAVMFGLSFTGYFVLAFLPWLSCPDCPCPGCPVLAVLSWLSCSGCACPGCTVLAVMSWLSWSGCPVMACHSMFASSLSIYQYRMYDYYVWKALEIFNKTNNKKSAFLITILVFCLYPNHRFKGTV